MSEVDDDCITQPWKWPKNHHATDSRTHSRDYNFAVIDLVIVYIFIHIARCKRGFHDTMFVFRVGLIVFIVFCACSPLLPQYCSLDLQMKMLSKISPEGQKTQKTTWTSRFVRLLINICFFPITIKGKKICFSLLSWKILIHFALGIVFFTTFAYFGLSSINFVDNLKDQFTKVSNVCRYY